jgi:hypothetical protein
VDESGALPPRKASFGRNRPSSQRPLVEIVHSNTLRVGVLPLRQVSAQWHGDCSKGSADFHASDCQLRKGRGAVVVVVAVDVGVDTRRPIASREKRVALPETAEIVWLTVG